MNIQEALSKYEKVTCDELIACHGIDTYIYFDNEFDARVYDAGSFIKKCYILSTSYREWTEPGEYFSWEQARKYMESNKLCGLGKEIYMIDNDVDDETKSLYIKQGNKWHCVVLQLELLDSQKWYLVKE
jgi:hypothetical protein